MNLNRINSFSIEPEKIDSHYSLSLFSTQTIERLLTDIYSIIKEDKELLQNLLVLREFYYATNSQQEHFKSIIIQPLSGRKRLIKEHNENISIRINDIKMISNRIIKQLEEKYGFENPFKETSSE